MTDESTRQPKGARTTEALSPLITVLVQIREQLNALQSEVAHFRRELHEYREASSPPITEAGILATDDPPRAPVTAPLSETAATRPTDAPRKLLGTEAFFVPADPTRSMPRLYPNGINGATGAPLLQIDIAAASQIVTYVPTNQTEQQREEALHQLHTTKQEHVRQEHLGVVFGIDEDKLDESLWAVVVNDRDPADLLKALLPLIEHRSREQGIILPPLTFREGETCGNWYARHVPNPNVPWQTRPPVLLYRSGETTERWLQRHSVSQGPVDPRRGVPFYLLLLAQPGDLGSNAGRPSIPFLFQYELDMFWSVGRLCFTDAQGQHCYADYTAYAERVVAFEGATPAYQKQVAFFGPRHETDLATQLSADKLITPLVHGYNGQAGIAERNGFAQHVLLGPDATRSNLEAVLRGTSTRPALLFGASHGVGFPADDARLLAHQGALLCQDWTGFGSIRREHWLAGEDLTSDTRMDGLIAFLFACYGAGCPQEDQFVFEVNGNGSTRRPFIAPYDMIAQLPQRMLAHGCLAVLGHIDRAWSHSFD
ncbi:MAG: peptidase C1, partial [Chloroflexaceae bacterium]|nr:peptidase C1 [Chloroflexaceae bacterium]